MSPPHAAVPSLRGRAPAKVNLGLAVTGQRPDGYHELASVFARVSLADGLCVTPGAPGAPDTLTITGDADCPVAGNLVLRAAAALRSALPGDGALPGLRIELEKRIPMGAGLAGGSTDAATALRLAAVAWGVADGDVDLARLGARLGADVPFFVTAPPAALVTGVGEQVRRLPPLRTPAGVLLVTPPFGMATPAVFAAFDRRPRPGPGAERAVEALAEAWAAGLDGPALAERAAGLRSANDLWPAVVALEPRMARLREALETELRRPVLLTGSGSTLVALYPSPEAARAAAAALSSGDLAGRAAIRVTATCHDQPHDEDTDA